MRLFEHPDFEQALIRAADHHGVTEQFVEKDYYVTEILRIVAETQGEHAIFKGGTSLSKGWGLITRFSEDVDLFIDRDSFSPRPGKGRAGKILKGLAEAVSKHPALTWLEDESASGRGLWRRDVFSYDSHFSELPGLRPGVRLEPGVRSGTFPTQTVAISSLVADFLASHGAGDLADAEDLAHFDMSLLHYRRTFVEKMFALHASVIRLEEVGDPLERDARHYADLYALAEQVDVQEMLESSEYREIVEDQDRISLEHFSASYLPPEDLSFSASPAFFPGPELRAALAAEHDEQCRLLFPSSDHPTFDDVMDRFEKIRSLL